MKSYTKAPKFGVLHYEPIGGCLIHVSHKVYVSELLARIVSDLTKLMVYTWPQTKNIFDVTVRDDIEV